MRASPTLSAPVAATCYLTALQFTRACRCFAAETRLEFRHPLTLLVGDQGAGKSTVLAAIRRAGTGPPPLPDDPTADLQGTVQLEGPLNCAVELSDLERANPRMRTLEDPFSTAEMARLHQALYARRHSHGEALLPLLDRLDQLHTTLIVLDTPEMALSPRNQYRLARILARAITRGCQVIAATHSAILIAEQSQVLDLTHQHWIASTAYLAAAQAPP